MIIDDVLLTRPSQIEEGELTWYWGDARGILGLRAQSYEPSIGGEDVCTNAREREDAKRRAIAKFERISATLARMRRDDVRVLQRWCGTHRPDPLLATTFDRFAGIVTRTKEAHTLAEKLKQQRTDAALRMLCSMTTAPDLEKRGWARDRIVKLKGEAERMLSRAVNEYRQARPKRVRA